MSSILTLVLKTYKRTTKPIVAVWVFARDKLNDIENEIKTLQICKELNNLNLGGIKFVSANTFCRTIFILIMFNILIKEKRLLIKASKL
ncbi:hypothetical protein BpHYR1_033466 [Brachionus plicatilis]|uniref:Uncharacterized protein n=1 Tax=Brachionus plicatilis TaxID=10195 RepID=A0A3M7ST99_BRAPC|nr:hypothetical protein BpHYR1_033466 [Brachionus plicatilis]